MENEIHKIREQYAAGMWPKFLETITIDGLRGWKGQSMNFRFPVTAIVGENGTGKSTFLKAAACIYENEIKGSAFYPSDFFVSTYWDSISGVTLGYTVRQGNQLANIEIRKPTKRWSFPEKRPKRPVLWFDIARTLPLDASAGYAKIAKLTAGEISTQEILPDFRNALSHILGRKYIKARFSKSNVDKKREVGLLTREFGEISQFHQGAGEDAALDMIRSLQSIPPNSLLLIDELEASLHPKAQRRLVRFLLWLARQKRAQIIISTHSHHVLAELPPEARIMLLPGQDSTSIVYGASPEYSLSRLDEDSHPELQVFVEDREAEILLREILASDPAGKETIQRLQFAPVGPSNVVRIMGELGIHGKLPYKSMAVLDGDETPSNGCLTLPGNKAPERVVFEGLKAINWKNLPERFGIGAGDLFAWLDDAMLIPDHHEWTSAVGNRVIKSKMSVWETLAAEWARSCLDPQDRKLVVEAVQTALVA